MNLYQINFKHYSQKDSAWGINTHLVAKSDEDVYEWVKANLAFYDEYYKEDDPDFKQGIIESKGCMYNEEALDNLSDLYYGETLYGWKLLVQDVQEEEIEDAERLNISIKRV